MFSYNLMQSSLRYLYLSTICCKYFAIAWAICFLFFLLLSACSRETVPERVTVPHISFIFTWQVLHCAETSQCLVGLSLRLCHHAPLSQLSLLSRCLGIFRSLRSRGVSCHFDGGPSAACHQQHHQQKAGGRRQLRLCVRLRLRLWLQLQLRRALPAAAAFLLFYSPNVIAKCACLVHISIVAIVFWAFLLLCAFSCSSNVPLRQWEAGEESEGRAERGGNVVWLGKIN